METQDYNGWSNRETWATMLHIDNDEGLLTPILEVTQRHENPWELAEEIEAFITEDVLNFDNVSTNRNAFNMLTDIGSLYRVNWREISESLLENVKAKVFSADDDVETVAWSSSNPTGERLSNV